MTGGLSGQNEEKMWKLYIGNAQNDRNRIPTTRSGNWRINIELQDPNF